MLSAAKRTVDPGGSAERLELLLGEEFRDRRAHLTRVVEDEIGETLRAPLLRELLEPLQLAARERFRRDEVADGLRAGEDPELGAARDVGRVLDLEAEADVRLVGAVAEHRVGVRHARERP